MPEPEAVYLVALGPMAYIPAITRRPVAVTEPASTSGMTFPLISPFVKSLAPCHTSAAGML